MAAQSHYWKQLLLRQVPVLDRLGALQRWNEASSVKLEESVVLAFYTIRKLINSFLLDQRLVHQPIRMTVFPVRHGVGPLMGDEPFGTLYDLDSGHAAAHDLLFLCHQVTGNCLFEPCFSTDQKLRGIYFTSDHQRKAGLYCLDIESLREILQHVGKSR